MSPPSSPYRFDVGQLLQDVAEQESEFYPKDAGDFGHPDPPSIDIVGVKRGVLLVVAYTPHFVYAQVVFTGKQQYSSTTSGDSQPRRGPRRICRVQSDIGEDEVITSLAVLCLEDEALIRALSEVEGDEDRVVLTRAGPPPPTSAEKNVAAGDGSNSPSLHESTAVLLKGMVSLSSIGAEDIRLAVVIGTNFSHVYAVELRLDADGYELATDVCDLCEILPRDEEGVAEKIKRRRMKLSPFRPAGGVASMFPFRCPDDKSLYLWITYGDATMIRLHSAGFFPSIWQYCVETGESLDLLIGRRALMRCQLHFTKAERDNADKIRVVPLPVSYPSPFSTLERDPVNAVTPCTEIADDDDSAIAATRDDGRNRDRPIVEALTYGLYEDAATLSFYTSEVQIDTDMSWQHWVEDESESDVLGIVVGGTKAIVGGMVGLGLGALRWTIGSNVGPATAQSRPLDESRGEEEESQDAQDHSLEIDLSTSPVPSLWREPVTLYPAYDFPDPPRLVDSCSIDPEGQLAALTDSLGRVLLFDLSTKQVLRLWKGYRDASCSWTYSDCFDEGQKAVLLLVIHSRQRRVIDVWRVRHGPRVSSMQVGRDSELLSCPFGSSSSQMAATYIVHSKTIGSLLNKVEEVTIDEAPSPGPQSSVLTAKASSSASSREATYKLQHLRQLLSTPTVRLDVSDVYDALRAVTSLTDLATSLDLLSEANLLEDKLGVTGSSFQKLAVNLCNETLVASIKRGANRDVQVNPNVSLLSRKIEYHTQLIKAYDVFHKFETTSKGGERSQDIRNPSHWVMEAMGWASTYQKVMRVDLDRETAVRNSVLRFTSFASACKQPIASEQCYGSSKIKIYFSDSSRARRDILVHVFEPLLSDVFASRVVSSIFESLGTGNDHAYMQKCFGEWTMTLSVQELYRKGLLAAHSPLTRFLKDIAMKQLDKGILPEGEVVLGVLHSLCSNANDLVRSFMLAVICRDASERAASRKEKMTYGRILSGRVLRDWDVILRKLRVSLLVSLRLKHVRLAAPISIASIEEEGLFSVFEWLAHDELTMSYKHDEITALEDICKLSSFAFDPSTSDGDGPSRFKQLQNACLSAAVGDDRSNSEYLIEMSDEDRFGSLLLFFRSHNHPFLLAAHRVRLLVLKWLSAPSDLGPFHDALVSLDFLRDHADTQGLALALALELWRTCSSPVYKAQLHGFEDVHELSEEVLSPLFFDDEWLRSFGTITLRLLEILKRPWPLGGDVNRVLDVGETDAATWPPVRTDHTLVRLVETFSRVDQSAIAAHIAAVVTLLISRDSDSLVRCVPGIQECFFAGSLSRPMVQPVELRPHWFSFIEDAVLSRARSYEGEPLDTISLGEVETLCDVWGFDVIEARTLFLLAMYEVGKDRLVDELLSRGPAVINSRRFVEGGVDVACRRLHAFLSGREMQSPEMQDTVGRLDAELCEWMKTRARMSLPSTPVLHAYVSVGQTHLFTLRLLSLSASSDIETAMRVKIHAMVVLSGTLVKVLEIRSGSANRRSG